MMAASTYLGADLRRDLRQDHHWQAHAITGRVVVDPLARLGATTYTHVLLDAGTLGGTLTASPGGSYARNARLSYLGNDVLLTLDPGLLSTLPDAAHQSEECRSGDHNR
jgi:hypothetical protein